jgi:hypothetical protein
MRDADPQPGQPDETVMEATLAAEGDDTVLVVEERGLPVKLLAAYGAGVQIHVENLADYLNGREPRDTEALWNQLFPLYEAVAANI